MSTAARKGEHPTEGQKGPWWGMPFARLGRINDSPHSVALGSAVGMFFGFTPLFGLKTLLSIVIAWVFRSNKMAAAITVTLHDIILPFAPVIFYLEYQIGLWMRNGQFPQRPQFQNMALRDYMEWTTFFTLGQPMLIGSLFLGLPSAVITYFFMRTFVARAHLARKAVPEKAPVAQQP